MRRVMMKTLCICRFHGVFLQKNLRRWRSRRFAYVTGMTGADVFSLWVAKDREVSWAGPSFAKIEGKETSDGYFALHL